MADLEVRQVVTHQCCCVIYDDTDLPGMRCGMQVEGTDNPFCYQCEDRHPGSTFIVSAEL